MVHGTDQHTALVNAAGSCACGLSVWPGTSVPGHRTGDHLVEFDMHTGQTIQRPATGAYRQPDTSCVDATQTILVNLALTGRWPCTRAGAQNIGSCVCTSPMSTAP